MASDLSVPSARILARRSLVAAVLVNIAMGVIYAWGVFLLPLENYLAVSRAELSSVPAIALISFTAGMVLHDRALRMLGRRRLSMLAFALTSGGHFLFALVPSYWFLLVGYGLLFGVGAGLGYGLALALASDVPPGARPTAIGLTMGAFAFSGIVMPIGLSSITSFQGVASVFGVLGAAIAAIGVCATALVADKPMQPIVVEKTDRPRFADTASNRNFIKLALIFFCICFVGLMTISQLSGIVSSQGLSAYAGQSLSILTVGYLVGSLFGGQAVRRLGGWRALLVASAVAAAGLVFLDVGTLWFAMVGAACIGIIFGSSASLMPTLIGDLHGSERIGEIYGRLMISYGLAGLIAPWGAGALYVAFGGYGPALLLGLLASAVSAILAVSLRMGSARSD